MLQEQLRLLHVSKHDCYQTSNLRYEFKSYKSIDRIYTKHPSNPNARYPKPPELSLPKLL